MSYDQIKIFPQIFNYTSQNSDTAKKKDKFIIEVTIAELVQQSKPNVSYDIVSKKIEWDDKIVFNNLEQHHQGGFQLKLFQVSQIQNKPNTLIGQLDYQIPTNFIEKQELLLVLFKKMETKAKAGNIRILLYITKSLNFIEQRMETIRQMSQSSQSEEFVQGDIIIRPQCAKMTSKADSIGRLDLMVKIWYNAKFQKSKVAVDCGKEPEWSDKLVFKRRINQKKSLKKSIDCNDQELDIRILIFEIINLYSNKEISVCTAEYDIGNILEGKRQNESLAMHYKDKNFSTLYFFIEFQRLDGLSKIENEITPSNKGLGTLKISPMQGTLQLKNPNRKIDLQCAVIVRDEIFYTKVDMDCSGQPKWHQDPFIFRHKHQFIELKAFEIDGYDSTLCAQAICQLPQICLKDQDVHCVDVVMFYKEKNVGLIQLNMQYVPDMESKVNKGLFFIKPFMAELSRENTVLQGKNNFYVKVIFNGEDSCTKVAKKGGARPLWDDELSFKKTMHETEAIIEVWDENSITQNDMIGHGVYNIEYLMKGIEDTCHLDLKFKGKKSGQIFFDVEFVNEGCKRQKYLNMHKKHIHIEPKKVRIIPGNLVAIIQNFKISEQFKLGEKQDIDKIYLSIIFNKQINNSKIIKLADMKKDNEFRVQKMQDIMSFRRCNQIEGIVQIRNSVDKSLLDQRKFELAEEIFDPINQINLNISKVNVQQENSQIKSLRQQQLDNLQLTTIQDEQKMPDQLIENNQIINLRFNNDVTAQIFFEFFSDEVPQYFLNNLKLKKQQISESELSLKTISGHLFCLPIKAETSNTNQSLIQDLQNNLQQISCYLRIKMNNQFKQSETSQISGLGPEWGNQDSFCFRKEQHQKIKLDFDVCCHCMDGLNYVLGAGTISFKEAMLQNGKQVQIWQNFYNAEIQEQTNEIKVLKVGQCLFEFLFFCDGMYIYDLDLLTKYVFTNLCLIFNIIQHRKLEYEEMVNVNTLYVKKGVIKPKKYSLVNEQRSKFNEKGKDNNNKQLNEKFQKSPYYKQILRNQQALQELQTSETLKYKLPNLSMISHDLYNLSARDSLINQTINSQNNNFYNSQ